MQFSWRHAVKGGHHHIRIEGKWTKGSAVTKDLAVYMDGLRKHLASTFAKALRLESTDDELVVHGFESLVVTLWIHPTGLWERSGTGRNMPI